MIVAAFPATGKTFACGRDRHLLDSDSSRFSWVTAGVRHPDWPENYVRHIEGAHDAGRIVLCSSHQEVRDALCAAGLRFALVYPTEDQRDAYIERMTRRGSPPKLVTLIAGQWDGLIGSCRAQEGCEHYVLDGPDRYLTDVLPGVAGGRP